ncbi:Ribosomal protein L9/RNase H1, N-terminal [Sesbania bispinosa]|nr:Ribosomal protein L9/RNase H1, N-terminal [Sesbania bispinosa]
MRHLGFNITTGWPHANIIQEVWEFFHSSDFMSSDNWKWYVVFEGKRPGIYSSWLNCQVQISGYKDARYLVYKCRDLVVKAWFEYHRTGGSSTSFHIGDEKDSGFLIKVCMQELLLDTTKKFRIPPPEYTLQDKKIVDNQELYRCYGSLQTNLIGKPPACLGEYAETEFEARETVALQLLQRWQPGIYSSWVECHQQVNGFPSCLFRSYSLMEEAQTEWLRYWGVVYVGDVPANVDNNVPEQVDLGEEPVDVVVVEGGVVMRPKASHLLTWVVIVTFFLTLAMLIVSSVLAL